MMADIIVELLLTKQTHQRVVDKYDENGQAISYLSVTAAVNRSGYQVIAGESNATEITVYYPPQYRNGIQVVYMKNARGEFMNIILEPNDPSRVARMSGEQRKQLLSKIIGAKRLESTREVGDDGYSFTLPAEMTFAGNTFLTFYVLQGDTSSIIQNPDGLFVYDNEKVTKTIWQPVVVPILATGVDYKRVAMASPDILDDAIRAIDRINKLFPVDSTNADNIGVANVFVADSGKLTFENLKGNTGDTPYIQNGNWWINGVDTGVQALGVGIDDISKTGERPAFDDPVITIQNAISIYTITYADGSTQVFEVRSGIDGGLTIEAQNAINANTIVAQQAKEVADSVREDADNGLFNGTDGDTPYIQNGNWWINGIDTGIKAIGVDGEKGENGIIINENIFLGFEQGNPFVDGEYTVTPINVLASGTIEFSVEYVDDGDYTNNVITVTGV